MFVAQILVLMFMLLCLGTILWSTVRYGISPMPSSSQAQRAMQRLIPKQHSAVFIELGSGWGQLSHRLAIGHPEVEVIGYERSLLPFLFSRLFYRAENMCFQFVDFNEIELPDEAVLFCYLYPGAMMHLHTQLQGRQLWLISNSFALRGRKPIRSVELSDLYRTKIYLYRMDG